MALATRPSRRLLIVTGNDGYLNGAGRFQRQAQAVYRVMRASFLSIVKIGLNALIVLTVNDFASSARYNSGRMRHCWDHGDAYGDQSEAYFAQRFWDNMASSE